MSSPLTDAAFVVLSLLAEGPKHGYELEALIEARGLREWTQIGFSSIYFLLGRLQKLGLAKPVRSRSVAKARRSFEITPKGLRCVSEQTLRMISLPHRVFPQVLLGIANWPSIAPKVGSEALGKRREALSAELIRLQATRDAQHPLPDFVEAVFDYAASQIQADIEWTERTQSRLRETMEKIDFKARYPDLYAPPSGKFVNVDVPSLKFVKVNGAGDPNKAPAYELAVVWLYSVSYAMKFAAKAAQLPDYIVPPLEGLWWADDPTDFVTRRKDRWQWTMMIRVPEFIEQAIYKAAVEKSTRKLGAPPESLRLETYKEGPSLQILHVGSYDAEAPVLEQLHRVVMPAQGLDFNGPHHEIYLNDPRKTASSKLKTILRQPVKAGRKQG